MSTSPISPALTQTLKAGRSHFNARVNEACRIQPGFDTAEVHRFVMGPLDVLATQAFAFDQARANSFIVAAFECAITLQLRGKSELPIVRAIWQTLVPACLPLAMENARDTLGSLFNAGLNMHGLTGVRTEQWVSALAQLAPSCSDLETLRRLGQVLAWRSGAAHFRQSALTVLDQLPTDIAKRAIPSPHGQEWSETIRRMREDPWFDPVQPVARGLRQVHEVGGFTGFGGPFSEPPDVRVYGDGFVLRSADRYWYLCADVFGAVLHAGSVEEFSAGEAAIEPGVLNSNRVRIGSDESDINLPSARLRAACGPHTIALASPYSHFVVLMARA